MENTGNIPPKIAYVVADEVADAAASVRVARLEYIVNKSPNAHAQLCRALGYYHVVLREKVNQLHKVQETVQGTGVRIAALIDEIGIVREQIAAVERLNVV